MNGDIYLTDDEKVALERETRLKNRIINALVQKLQEFRNLPMEDFMAFLKTFTAAKAKDFIKTMLQKEADQYKNQKASATNAEKEALEDKAKIDTLLV